MKLQITLINEEKTFEEKRILSDIEIEYSFLEIDDLLNLYLEEMKNKIIKDFLNNSIKYKPSNPKNK